MMASSLAPTRLTAALLAMALAAGCTAMPPEATPPPVGATPSAGASTPSPVTTDATEPPLAPSAVPSAVIDHPTGATDVVLRMQRGGGFLYPGTTIDVPATFTLYGDGAVIHTVDDALGANDPRRVLRVARMTEDQMAALLTFAFTAGGLAEAGELYDDVPVADATDITFSINAAGIAKRVVVYALNEGLDEPGPEAAHRERFLRLFELLRTFNAEVARGNASDVGPFEPEAYRVTLFPDESGEFPASAEWPWDDLQPADFERDQGPFLRRVLTPEQAALAAELPVAEEIGDPIVRGPDEINYLIRLRPLLPDELE